MSSEVSIEPYYESRRTGMNSQFKAIQNCRNIIISSLLKSSADTIGNPQNLLATIIKVTDKCVEIHGMGCGTIV